MTLIQKKALLRQKIKKDIAYLKPGDRTRWSQSLSQILENNLSGSKVVLVFAALDGEPDILSLAWKWKAAGIEVALPRMAHSQIEAWPLPKSRKDLKPGALGNLEPQTGTALNPARLDLCLVPGLAFSPKGTRLGRGGGSFDQFLAGCHAQFWGIAFEMQIHDSLPHGPQDIAMHALVTEKRFQLCAPG